MGRGRPRAGLRQTLAAVSLVGRKSSFGGVLLVSGMLSVGVMAAVGALDAQAQPTAPDAPTLSVPSVVMTGVSYDVTADAPPAFSGKAFSLLAIAESGSRQELQTGTFQDGLARESVSHTASVTLDDTSIHRIALVVEDETVKEEPVRVLPGWLSLLPPLLAIALALIARQVLLALFSGVFVGAFIFYDFNPWTALLRTIDTYVVGRVADADNASVLIFSLCLGGMIGVVTKSGGGRGLVMSVTRWAKSARSGQLSTWVMGCLIFFDDYANSLLVGTSMRPISDRLRISREKLAFLVDATAAPVASLALVSSWIGVEVGYIQAEFEGEGIQRSAYWAFVESLPQRFYPILMLFFGFALIWMGRDFGPMWKAEDRARRTGKVLRDGAEPASSFDESELKDREAPPRWENAAVPVCVVMVAAIWGMYVTGRDGFPPEADPSLRDIFGEANSYAALLWASGLGSLAAMLMAKLRGGLSVRATFEAWSSGAAAMLPACMILVLAWSLGHVCRHELFTANFVIGLLGDGLSGALLPAAVFVIAAAISFATGTSYGTMAILFPLVIPLAAAMGDYALVVSGISSILAGAVWGDHCSPLSDTTILSSMAASCDHVDHVRTQLPYALTVGIVAIVFGELGTGLGLYPSWVGLLLGMVVLWVIIRYVGKPVRSAGAKGDDQTALPMDATPR